MRGVVLLLVGVALIWLGIEASDGGGEEGAGPQAAAVEEQDSGTVESELQHLSVPSGSGTEPRAEAAGRESAEDHGSSEPSAGAGEGEPRTGDVPPDGPPAGAASDDVPEPALPPAPDRAPAVGEGSSAPVELRTTLESASRTARAEEAPMRLEAPPAAGPAAATAPVQRRDGSDAPSEIRLGEPAGDSAALARALLEAWLARDPAVLEGPLNDEQAGHPAGRRRLVATFWQSLASSNAALAAEEADRLGGAEGVTTAELELLRAASDVAPDRAVPAAAPRRDPLARAMRMVLLEERARRASEMGDHGLAARSWSDLIQLELDAEWPPHHAELLEWAKGLNAAQAHHRLDPAGDWPSRDVEVRPNDSLSNLRARLVTEDPRLCLCVELLRTVNRVGRFIHPGQVLRAPTDPPNVIVDLDARLVVYRHGGEAVMAWECGIGKEGHETPVGTYTIGLRQEEPAHMPDGGRQLPYGHPDNPLGTRWMAWYRDGEKTTYGFHGTSHPEGVGDRVSQGCVRMRNEDVEELYDLLPVGAKVVVQP